MSEVFDPRALVMPPFRACPACAKDHFGIALIGGTRYMRRCCDCWHKQFFPLPIIRKRIIYLDQFVISNLMKLENPALQRNDRLVKDDFWAKLRILLTKLRQLQLICCPDSGSHVAESRISLFNDELKKTYEELSGGISFTSFDGISSSQIGELARAWSEAREPKFDFDPSAVLSKDPHQWNDRFYIVFGNNPFVFPAQVQLARADTHSTIARLFTDVWSKEKQTFRYWYDLERKGYQGYLGQVVVKSRKERLETTFAFKPGIEPSLDDLERTMPSYPEALLFSLQHIMRFPRNGSERTTKERELLEKSFGEANRIAEAPFVKLQAMMFAAIAMRAAAGQKEPPNEGTTTDVETVAHLLPYCDAMFMDNGCRSLLMDVPLDVRPPEVVKVFSPKVRGAFLDYLQSIHDNASAEHLELVRELYGNE